MDEHYARTVRLLLTAAPAVFDNAIFAMKGGTAINLFIQDMPRLSVDIDVVYIPWQPNREEALHDIAAELERIRARLAPLGLIVRTLPSRRSGGCRVVHVEAVNLLNGERALAVDDLTGDFGIEPRPAFDDGVVAWPG